MKSYIIMAKQIFVASLLFVSTYAFSTYNSNITGVVDSVMTYSNDDGIYFHMSNQPTNGNGCNAAYFEIDAAVSADRKKAMLARLLTAYAMHDTITVGYDGTGGCTSGGMLQVYRIG
jgi:hypothetical protein